MSAALTTAPKNAGNNALMALAGKLKVDHQALTSALKSTVFSVSERGQVREPTNEEFLALVVTANSYDLNPVLRELYAFPKKGGGIVPVVSVDGWLKIINRQKNFDGMEVEVFHGEDGVPTHATCIIWIKDRNHPVKITEYYAECFRDTEPWRQMPSRLLRHKAVKECGRVAFGIGGLFDEDEAEAIRDVTPIDQAMPTSVVPMPKARSQQAAQPSSAKAKKEEPEGSWEVFELADVALKEGTSNKGRTWTLWTLTLKADGKSIYASTFSGTVGGKADDLRGLDVEVQLERTEKGISVEAIRPANEGQAVEGDTLL